MKDATAPVTIYRKDYQRPPYVIETVDLIFDIDASQTDVRARLSIRRDADAAQEALRLDGAELALLSIAIDGQSLRDDQYERDGESLTVFQVPETFELETLCRIHPDRNTALEGLYQSGQFLLTQCEAEGFRKITYFLDRPDVMATYRVRLQADATRYPVLLSNGNQIESGTLDDGRHYAVWDDPFPKPSYLFALVAGDLQRIEDRFTTSEGREVTLRIYVEEENLDQVDYAMASLKKSMLWDEQRFALAYDLDIYNIVATNDFNMGAMENKSLNIFNSKYVLAKPETATDADFLGIEAVIGHEYFHNWTGNRVTCRDWFQLSLKEGLTVFRDQEFSSDLQSRAVKRIEDVRVLRSHQFAEDAGPMAHPVRPDSFVEINNFYTLTVYEKGAEVVRMYHTLLGEEGFQRGMKLYFERHDGQAVTCDDFRAAMADANQTNLDQFERWYLQAGTPVVDAEGDYDSETQRYTLTLRQRTPDTPGQTEKLPLHMPMRLGLLGADGTDLPLSLVDGALIGAGDVVQFTEAEQQFVFADIAEPPVPSLFRGFSAPVKLNLKQGQDELAFLMAHDSDSFNRWDASQRLAVEVLMRLIEDPSATPSAGYIDAVGVTLGDQQLDPALIAEALRLPDENYLAAVMADRGQLADVDGIHRARNVLRQAIASAHGEQLRARYQALHEPQVYELTPAAVAARSLKNACLGLLGAVGEGDLARLQFTAANNMTDSMAALRTLVHEQMAEAEHALANFYERWSSDPLVMDKWLALQATDSSAGAIDRITSLLEHDVFSLKNPNKVRSLIGAFAMANPVQFHRTDGAGYAWVAERVMEVDALNPQVAARLVRAFDPWARYDSKRQQLMLEQLRRLAAAGLSRDTGEIVDKALAEADG